MSNKERLVNVIQAFSDNGLSLRSFIIQSFEYLSKDPNNNEDEHDRKIRGFVKGFCSRDGHAAVLNAWRTKLRRFDHPKLIAAAVDFVVDRISTELNRLTSDRRLRRPAGTVTRPMLEDFAMDFITERLKEHAPALLRLLTGLTSVNGNHSRDASVVIPTVASIFIFLRSQQSNYLQMMMGLYLYSSKCSSHVISVISQAGLSVSRVSIQTALRSMTKDALDRMRRQVAARPWYLVYDNINIANKKFDQRLDNADSFDNGTAATVVMNGRLGRLERPIGHVSPYAQFSMMDLTPDASNHEYLSTVFQFYLVDVLRRHFGNFQRCSISIPSKNPLPTEKTEAYPLPSMPIDQSTIQGNMEVLDTVIQRSLHLDEGWFEGLKAVVVAGDQMTVSRIRSLMKLRSRDCSRYERLEWAEPILQLFHLQMLLSNLILRNFYCNRRTPASLSSIVGILNRKRVSPQSKPDFHATDDLLRHTFDAMALQAWDVALLIRRDEGEDGLEMWGENLDDATFDGLVRVVAKIMSKKYLFNDSNARDTHPLNENAALFLRDVTIYMELSAAIKAGDIGRISEILVWITPMLQSGLTTKYAYEILDLQCRLRHGWTPESQQAIMSSLLINTKGSDNSWIPSDLYQEHNNLLLKHVYAAKGSNASWGRLATHISTNIRTLSSIKQKIQEEYKVPYNGTRHTDVSATTDIRRVWEVLRDFKIFHPRPFVDEVCLIQSVTDIFSVGFERLIHGGFQQFLDNTKAQGQRSEYDPMDSGVSPEDNGDEDDLMNIDIELDDLVEVHPDHL